MFSFRPHTHTHTHTRKNVNVFSLDLDNFRVSDDVKVAKSNNKYFVNKSNVKKQMQQMAIVPSSVPDIARPLSTRRPKSK